MTVTVKKPINASLKIKRISYQIWKRVSTYLVIRFPNVLFKPDILETALSLMHKSNTQISVFLRGVKEGDIVFDVGANIGEFTILLSHVVGPNGKVHAFEPVPQTFEKLSQNVAKSPIKKQVVLNEIALSDHLGNAKIYMPISETTEASLTGHTYACWRSQSVQSFDCRLQTLDNYVEVNHIERVDFVKMDVEGAEMLVLQGMEKLLQGPSPPMLMLEAFPSWLKDFGFTIQDLFNLLTEHGYSVYFLGKDTIVPCLSANEMERLITFPHFVDFFCLIPQRHSQQMAVIKKYLPQTD
ncbi:MAG: FkbM family methyltransferase [Candidatus Bathyarchaeota archaeon]|nr:FkbM family methyltransferase [Candidatus Bathyarchaeota archaeon]